MNKSQSQRNSEIIRQHQSGKPIADLANDFNISTDRVRQIIELAKRHARRRAYLEGKYGPHPNVAELPDHTPIEVLLLCDARIAGWAVRIGHLQHPLHGSGALVLKTLGDLRSTTDAELLREPNVGRKMIAELRRFCPSKTEITLEHLFAKIRSLPSDRQALAIDALKKIIETHLPRPQVPS